MNTTAFLTALAAACISTSAIAAAPAGIFPSADKTFVTASPSARQYTPPLAHAKGLKPIFSNLATLYPKGVYFCCSGPAVSGPKSVIAAQIWFAAAFTPAANMTVQEVDVAIGYVAGTDQVVINLAADSGSGTPGTVLKSWTAAGMSAIGSCCNLAVGSDHKGIAVTAGTTYWVTLTTNGKDPDFYAAWLLNTSDMIDTIAEAHNTGSGWTPVAGLPGLSFGVYGK